MGVLSRLARDGAFYARMLRVLSRLQAIKPKAGYGYLTPDVIEMSVDAHPDNVAFIFEGASMSYTEFDAIANRVAQWGLAQGLAPGDAVALFMPNRPEYVAIWYGLSKIGVISALINNQLLGSSLAHCVDVGRAKAAIVDGDLIDVYSEAEPEIESKPEVWRWGGSGPGHDIAATLMQLSSDRPDPAIRAHIKASEPALRIYTSGTTGMPKAANVTHLRARNYMTAFAAASGAEAIDRMLIALPLYHSTGGLCGIGPPLLRGGAIILDRKFSTHRFWNLAADHGATMMIYVGEMCRFLTNAEPHPREKQNTIRVAIGNGLRADVWEKFVDRFDIPWVMEFYGSTEGNVSLINLDNQVGAVGRIPSLIASRFNARIVRFDFDKQEPARGEDGFCIQAELDEVGEMLGEIRSDDARYRFEGYEGRQEETQKKVLRDVFKQGDLWFRTGDLMSRDDEGYIYFVDRVGDTFRWKSENVSTTEVGEALTVFDGVHQANVYGVTVPGYDGRAGMAAVTLDHDVDFKALADHLSQELPSYARPVFLRIIRIDPSAHTTGTFKYQKQTLVQEGFNVDLIPDQIYIADDAVGFRQLDADTYNAIRNGAVRL